MIYRFFVCFLAFLLCSLSFYGQTYTYTNKEVTYTDWREKVAFVSAPGQYIHLLKWGRSGMHINVYDQNLQFRHSKQIAGTIERLSFLYFNGFYYAIATNNVKTKVYAIDQQGSYIDKTEEVTSRLSLNKAATLQLLTQGKSLLFFTQQLDDDVQQQTYLKVTVLDSVFTPITQFTKDIAFQNGRPPQLTFSTINDDLMILYTARGAASEGFTAMKLDVATGNFLSKRFVSDGLHFLSHQMVPQDSSVVLQSRVSEWSSGKGLPKTYSYFIKLNSKLEVERSLFLNDSSLKTAKNPDYYFRTVMTMPLENSGLLLVDYGRALKEKTISKGMLRYIWIDAALNIQKEWSQLTTDYRYVPSLLLTSGKNIHAYYPENVRERITLINTYELKEDIYNDQSLQLNPKYQYQLTKAISLNASSFIMPYINRARVGLVKVQVGK